MDPVEDFLQHFGVKGMKWGVRKARQTRQDNRGKGRSASDRKIKKLDKRFERSAKSLGVFIDVHNAAAKTYNTMDVTRINSSPKYKNLDFNKPSPLRDKYYAEHSKAFVARLEQAAAAQGTNASGTKRLKIKTTDEGEDGIAWEVTTEDVKHADAVERLIFKPIMDAKGMIIDVELVEDKMAQDALTDEFLEHYGIKGMKWGTRRARGSDGLVKTNGGDKLPVSDDAKKFADTNSRLGKGGNTKTLSNKELQDLVTRMNLEQQFSTLNAKNKKSNPALKFVADTLVSVGKQQAQKVAQEQAGKLIAEMLKKK